MAAASVGTGLSAYTAIHYQGHVTAGDTVLVLDGGTPRGSFTVQVAQSWGAKVRQIFKTFFILICGQNRLINRLGARCEFTLV